MHCRHCGKEAAEQAVICVACGVPPRNGRKFCHHCGANTDELAEFCIKCGVRLAVGGATGLVLDPTLKSNMPACWVCSWAASEYIGSTWVTPALG